MTFGLRRFGVYHGEIFERCIERCFRLSYGCVGKDRNVVLGCEFDLKALVRQILGDLCDTRGRLPEARSHLLGSQEVPVVCTFGVRHGIQK